MQLKTETYKGISIRVIQNILEGGKKIVLAKWVYKKTPYQINGKTKLDVLGKAKTMIDKML